MMMMSRLLPDPFLSQDATTARPRAWLEEHRMLVRIPRTNGALTHGLGADEAVRVVALETPFISEPDRALVQLLFAARQRLTARMGEADLGCMPAARRPDENPLLLLLPLDDPAHLYTELSLFHANLCMLSRAYPVYGVYNQAWDAFLGDMRRYAPWLHATRDSMLWAALVHRTQPVLADYAQHKADYEQARDAWSRVTRARLQ